MQNSEKKNQLLIFLDNGRAPGRPGVFIMDTVDIIITLSNVPMDAYADILSDLKSDAESIAREVPGMLVIVEVEETA